MLIAEPARVLEYETRRRTDAPQAEKLAKFREVRNQIDLKIRDWALQRQMKQLGIKQGSSRPVN